MSKIENNEIENNNNIVNDNQTKPVDPETTVSTKPVEKEYDFVKRLKKDMVEIKIPVDPMNKHLKTEDVYINGYRWTIEKGKTVKVPRAVKEVLENAGII